MWCGKFGGYGDCDGSLVLGWICFVGGSWGIGRVVDVFVGWVVGGGFVLGLGRRRRR